MRKLYPSITVAGALVGSASTTSAFEAMLGGKFALHPYPNSRHHIMTLGAGDIVKINNCDRGWCAVTHGPRAGYIYLSRVLDGTIYGLRSGVYGEQDGGLAESGGAAAAPFNPAGDAVNAGVSILR